MDRVFNEGIRFENLKYNESALETGDYENCTFVSCDFSNADLSDINFLECNFLDCNFSLTKLSQTSLRDVTFNNCKLLGLHFEDCNNLMITIAFDKCTLDLCSFNKLNLKKTIFINSKITEVDFTETDLNNSTFRNCDLERTIFIQSNLEGVDFRTSYNFSIDPNLNRIKKAKFSLSAIVGLLDKHDIEIEE